MEKDFKYYMGLPYKIELERDPDTGGYMASIPLLRGCLTCGDDSTQALENLEDAKAAWIATSLEKNLTIPEPEAEKSYSGQLRLRIPKSLHREISRRAREEGVSMNQYCIALLSAGYATEALHA